MANTEAKEVKFDKDVKGGFGGGPKSLPKDALVMQAILKDMGVTEFEPRVVNQLLEFSYRYVTNVLDDAKMVAGHAKKKAVDLDDVKLAVQMYAEQNLTSPPSRDVLLELARGKNAAPLPVPKPTCGLRLPPDRHCLTACNYRLKARPKPKPPGYGGSFKSGMAGGQSQSASGGSSRQSSGAKAGKMAYPAAAAVTATTAPGKPQFTINPQLPGAGGGGGGAAPKPLIKVNPATPIPKIQIQPQPAATAPAIAGAAPANQPVFKISVQGLPNAGGGGANKRKAEATENNF